jgi:hypothetical protein
VSSNFVTRDMPSASSFTRAAVSAGGGAGAIEHRLEAGLRLLHLERRVAHLE